MALCALPAPRYSPDLVEVVGGILIGFGLLLVWLASSFRSGRSLLELVARTPPSAIDQLESGVVRVDGTVEPTEQGLVREPTSGAEVVWYRVTAQRQEVSPDGLRQTWHDLFTERESRDFAVTDATARSARIAAGTAGFLMAGEQFGKQPGVQVLGHGIELRHAPLTPELEHWVRVRCEQPVVTVRVQRWMLAPGTQVRAVGVAAPTGEEVRLEPHPSAEEVIVSTVDGGTLEEIMRRRRRNQRIVAGIGVPIIIAGVALLLL